MHQLYLNELISTFKTAVFGKLFRFSIRCSSLRATTHLVFSDSVSANISVCSGELPSSKEVVILKIHDTSFLLAWITSLSRTPETENSESRMSNTFVTWTLGTLDLSAGMSYRKSLKSQTTTNWRTHPRFTVPNFGIFTYPS